MNQKDRRQDILKAAVQLFANKGFRGTTTRDLATHAEVNEAIIFRYFHNKEELYRAILEEKMKNVPQGEKMAELSRLVESGDDLKFLSTIGHMVLERHEEDTTFLRLLLFSALEGHELSNMFVDSMPEKDPLSIYIQKRIDQGVFRNVDPNLASRAFVGMFFNFVQGQEIFGFKKKQTFEREEVVRTFVSIFLTGMKP